jgi:two-component system OmpR family response regulator
MDGTPHILIVDDDTDILTMLSQFLTRNCYRVSTAGDGAAMTRVMSAARIDLVVLDLMLPGEDGISLCRRMRTTSAVPIIMLTAMSEEPDRVIGLEMGADDYLTKPFSMRELLARIRAVLRRSATSTPGSAPRRGRVFEFAGWRLDAARRQLHAPSHALVDLRAAEFDILLALVERPEHVLTRDQLLDLARGRAATAFDRSIDVHVSRLRQKLEVDPKEPELIKTVRNGGYVFAAPVTLTGADR